MTNPTDAIRLELVAPAKPEPLDKESRVWLNSDLANLGEFPYEWGDVDPETVGEALRWDPERGWAND